jgi:pimeloyl-ACP methyl ester carboxylesterase
MFDGLYLAITCAEDVPRTDLAAEVAEGKATFLGDYRMRQQRVACALWGRSPVPRDFFTTVQSNAPVLLVAGANDPVTPPHYASQVAVGLKNKLIVVVPFGAHSLNGLEGIGCVDQLRHDLIERGSIVGLDTSCIAQIKRRGFPTELPQ